MKPLSAVRSAALPAAIACALALSGAPAPVLAPPPRTEPSVGTKISAIMSEAVRVASSVIGRNFMNSPTTPGQNTSGRKAASVVAVAAMIGQAMRLAARP